MENTARRYAMNPRTPARLILLLIVALCALGGPATYKQLTIAQILAKGRGINNAFVEVIGQVNIQYEFVYVSDESTCASTQRVCKLWFPLAEGCRVVGNRYNGLACEKVFMNEFLKPFHQDPAKPLVITGVRIRGQVQSVEGRDFETYKRPGFGHLGAYPAQIAAMEIDFDDAKVEPRPQEP
jgi:hypothetical protein